MALVLRRTTHVGLEIRGYTVAQWRRKQRRISEAKERLGQAFSTQSSSEGAVHFSAAHSETRRGGRDEEGVDIIGSVKRDTCRGQSTITVDVTP